MLFGSPSGIALSTQKSVHIASGAQTNLVSGQSTYIVTGKSLIASVAEKLSLFVQNAGMKMFAAKGKVEIQAHSDNIELTAQKTITLLSATERIEAAAKQEILLTSGGAYIRIKDGNIEIHAPGKIDIKGGQHSFSGPTSLDKTYNMEGKKADMRVRYVDADGNVPHGEPIKLASEDGAIHNVTLDSNGKGELKNIDFGKLVADQTRRSGE
jgi:type VI secretion system secreted protein VgrG